MQAWWLFLVCLVHPCQSRAGNGKSFAFPSSKLSIHELDGIAEGIKIYIYEPPEHLAPLLDLKKGVDLDEPYFKIEAELLPFLAKHIGRPGFCTVVRDASKADFFWVPNTMYGHVLEMKKYTRKALIPFLKYIVNTFPYYNRSGGRDHLFTYIWDNGPLCDWDHTSKHYNLNPVFRRIVDPMVIVGYHGMDGFLAPPKVRTELRSHCFERDRDIVLPQWNDFHKRPAVSPFGLEFLRSKAASAAANLFFWQRRDAGTEFCSPNIRHYLVNHYLPNCSAPGIYTATNTSLAEELAANQQIMPCNTPRSCIGKGGKGLFGLCPAGFGCWSLRFYDLIDQVTIPVILSDGIIEPFERFLDYRSFTVKVLTAPHLGTNEDGNVNFSGIVIPSLEALHVHGNSFRRACGGCAGDSDADACLHHPVAHMLHRLYTIRPWFSWDPSASKNVFKLLFLELHCRTTRGAHHPACMQNLSDPRSLIADLDYGI